VTIARRSPQAWLAAAIGLAAAAMSAYAWRLTGANGHLVCAAGFVLLGLAWGRLPAIAWLGALLILGGSLMRWAG
jgi:hypothetical protein